MERAPGLDQLFEAQRPKLLAIASRMLRSQSDAQDAVQTVWIRAQHASLASVDNLPGWLTTTLVRICIDVLRARRTRSEVPLEVTGYEEDVDDATDLEDKLALAEAAQGAMAMVFDTLSPAERVAFIMHDVFDFDFDEVSSMLGRSTLAARKLASRARQRLRNASSHEGDLIAHHKIAREYLDATRAGNLQRVLALLDPNAQLIVRSDEGELTISGAISVARKALSFRSRAELARVAMAGNQIAIASSANGIVTGLLLLEFLEWRLKTLRVIQNVDSLSGVDIFALDCDVEG